MSEKRYNIMHGVGHAKYLVSYHDGIKKHSDGSNFWDIEIFKNKKKLNECVKSLVNDGYVYGRV